MARRRFQEPKPFREWGYWYILVWEDHVKDGKPTRKRKRVKLATADMPEREALKIARETLRPMNHGLITVGSATLFNDFVTGIYQPTVLPLMAKSTQERYQGVIDNHLTPMFGDKCLRDITPLSVQQYLSSMATVKLSHESKDKIRDVLSSILGSAVKFSYLVHNPVEGLHLPPAKTGHRSKPYVTPQQFAALVELIPEPYATMVYTAVYTGLRASELIGLKWGTVHADSISIEERYCRGDWGRPKSEASNATIAVNAAVINRLQRLKGLTINVRAGRAVRKYAAVRKSGPDDLVFQSLQDGRPMRDNNVLTRHIKPAARTLGIGWVNWQVLRRSYATWLKMVGADVKDAQALMRHSKASTTLDIYQQFVPESQRGVVDRLGTLIQ